MGIVLINRYHICLLYCSMVLDEILIYEVDRVRRRERLYDAIRVASVAIVMISAMFVILDYLSPGFLTGLTEIYGNLALLMGLNTVSVVLVTLLTFRMRKKRAKVLEE